MGIELLKRLVEAHGISGREEHIRDIVIEAMRPLVDDLRVDALGNVIGHKKGDAQQRVLITGHMDEIGFFVNHIEADGYLRVLPVGGWDARQMMAQRCMVHGRKNLPGLFATTIPMQMLNEDNAKQPLKVTDFVIDLGLPADQVKEFVEVGAWVSMWQDLAEIGDMYSSKAMDDRVGVYVMLEALRQAKNHTADIFAVATVQEEVGLRGALTAAYGVDPTVGLAVDITPAVNTPGAPEHLQVSQLGGGATIKVMDSSSISDARLVQFCKQLAQARNIPYQLEILPRGGTDAGAIQRARAGVPVMTISVPTRYAHSVIEAVHKRDVQASIDLVTAFIEEVHRF
jgi:endoglucanase